jgi:hypothetical protein
MSDLDPILNHGAFLSPGWHPRIQSLLENPQVTDEAIDALLDAQRDAPACLREASGEVNLYDGGRASDPRVRLLGVWTVHAGGTSEKKLLERVLRDPAAAHLEGFTLREKGAAATLAAGLTGSPVLRVRALTAVDRGLPSVEELSALLAHEKLATLERLDLSGGPLKERFLKIVLSPAMSSLRALLLFGCEKLTQREFETFAAQPWPALESLRIGSSSWEPRDGSRDAVWKAPWFSRIRALAIEGMTHSEVPLLADGGALANLRTFSVSSTKLKLSELRPLLSQLRACTALGLSLPGTLDLASAEALIASGCVPQLEQARIEVTPEAREALLAAGLDTRARSAARTAARGYSISS